MSAQHTPGPWHATSPGGMWRETFIVWSTPDRCPVASLGDGMDGAGRRNGVRAANASLIAAAPQLLEALEHYVLAVAVGGGDDKASVMASIRSADDRARAAIAAARGQG